MHNQQTQEQFLNILRRQECSNHQGLRKQQPAVHFQSNVCQTTETRQPIFTSNHTDNLNLFLDKVELTINVMEFLPENLRVNVLHDRIELLTQKNVERTPHYMVTTRIFHLPQRISPKNSTCFINNEGVLHVTVAWSGS